MNPDTLIGRLAAVTDEQAGELVTAEDRRDLAERIMAQPPARDRRRGPRPMLWAPTGLAGVAAVTALAVVLSSNPDSHVNPARHLRQTGSPPIQAEALSFSKPVGGYITVRVKDPYADPARYQKEFKAHGLDFTLKLVPVSPSLVGTVVFEDGPGGELSRVKDITAKGACWTGGGGDACVIGVKIPTNFHGKADVVFGRTAKPGEPYVSSTSITAPGELLHGVSFVGDRVSEMIAKLRERGASVFGYRVNVHNYYHLVVSVPGTWYVVGADPYAPGKVMLSVSPKPGAMASVDAPPSADVPIPTESPASTTPTASGSATR